MSGLGSDTWLGIDDYDEDDDLHSRATSFVAAINWAVLLSIASQTRGVECQLSEKYSLGHFNLVRRLTFEDGVSWIVRLRLPELPSMFGIREAMKAADCMAIEVATMNYFRLNTEIPVPEVLGHDLSADNIVGAPYIFMSYIHGTVAKELQEAYGCEDGVFGSPEQDRRFWRQMAEYQVQLANMTFDKIGSIHQDGDQFTIGPEIETGKGPWDTPQQYYSDLVRHKMEVADADAAPEVRESDSFSFPSRFLELMESFGTREAGFSLVNRDFGAHNVLVDNEFNMVGFIDFDGVMSAPSAFVAQLPVFTDVWRPVPGHVETRPFAVARMEKTAHLFPKYVELVREASNQREVSNSTEHTGSRLADGLSSSAAYIAQGLNEFGQHQGWVNDIWSKAYDLLLLKE